MNRSAYALGRAISAAGDGDGLAPQGDDLLVTEKPC
jgi:hypothetical protein